MNTSMRPFRKLKKFKVLVGTPHYEGKNYCLDNYVNAVKTLTYHNYDVLVVDNSQDRKNVKKIKKMGVPAVHIKRKNKSTREVLAESHNYLREAAIKGGYDFLLHLESDIIPPANVIERLLSHQLPVVSGSYFVGFGDERHLMVQEIEPQKTGVRQTINLIYGNDRKYFDGKLHEVYACGLGVTLIHREILEKFPFRYIKGLDIHPDSFFAHDLNKNGKKQYLDTSILCEHDNRDWKYIENK